MNKLKQAKDMKNYEMKCLKGNEPRILVTEKFVTKNKLELKRTQEEIFNKIKNDDSFFGFTSNVLINYLNYENAKEILSKEYIQKIESGEIEYEQITDVYETVQDFLDYMVFAWMKAEDEKGMSASRSIYKLAAWMWLLGREDLESILLDSSKYNPYGSPALIQVSKKLGIKTPTSLIEFSKHPC